MHPCVPQSQYAPPSRACPAKVGKDRHIMSRNTDKSFFILSPLVNEYAGLYQQLFRGISTYKELGNHIIKQIKLAHAFRQIEQVRELSTLLLSIPIKECQLTAQYYLVWSECRESAFQLEALERIVEQSQTYKSQALSSI